MVGVVSRNIVVVVTKVQVADSMVVSVAESWVVTSVPALALDSVFVILVARRGSSCCWCC